ncbi:unnamed protein product [Moneuplotes crassus]|uniref:Uncharacterized protein n=1 Tax=Euplotes crassus TaxID=5936 RepID=A0AAD1Y0Y8_EUPCR|nr:unnamed protein product [Moneuplotes crassus]
MAKKKTKEDIIRELMKYDDLVLDKEHRLTEMSILLADTHNKLQNEYDKIEELQTEVDKTENLITKRHNQFELESKNIKFLSGQINKLNNEMTEKGLLSKDLVKDLQKVKRNKFKRQRRLTGTFTHGSSNSGSLDLHGNFDKIITSKNYK